MKTIAVIGLFSLGLCSLSAAELKESKFTQVINEVNILAGQSPARPAKVQETFKTPEVLRTGANARAELEAPDKTLTRIGGNTVFSFEPAGRTIQLQQGSLLFHSPKGKGGGTIKSGGASAAVLGTTLMVGAIPGGGIKVIFLEGKGKVTLANGRSVTLRAGQMVIIPPGATNPGTVYDIDLGTLVDGSFLVKGFANELPSWEEILAAIERQRRDIASGRFEIVDSHVLSHNNDPKWIDPTLNERGVFRLEEIEEPDNGEGNGEGTGGQDGPGNVFNQGPK